MAVNETIVTGRKFRKCIDAATKAWQRISFWTKSSDVEFEDGKNAETKLGAIDGITDSLEDTSSRMAASAKAVSTLNNNLGGYSFGETADGKPGYRKPGADTVIPFSSAYTYKTVNLGTYKAIRDGVAYLFFWSYASTGTYDGIIFTTTGSSKRIGYQSYNGQQSFLYQFNLKSGQTITTKAGPEYINSSAGTLIYPDGMF